MGMITSPEVLGPKTSVRERRRPRIVRAFLQNPGAVIGGFLVLFTITGAALGPALAPNAGTATNLGLALKPPFLFPGGSLAYPLGTDYVGRNLLALIVSGAQISVDLAALAVVGSMVVGTLIGLYSGYAGGRIGNILMRLTDLQMALPFILMALTVMAVSGPGVWKVILVLALSGWTDYARIVRGQTLKERHMVYVNAAEATGASWPRILFRHILPNISDSVIVLATMNIAVNILLEAGLAFLGLGLSPTNPSWGSLVADGQSYVETAWWLTVFPGLAIFLSVLGFNLLGDWLRDLNDPARRH